MRTLSSCAILMSFFAHACGGDTDADSESTQPATAVCSTEDPLSSEGENAVGYHTLTLEDPARPGVQRTIHIWYPASEMQGERAQYAVAGLTLDSETAVRDAPIASGIHPLIVHSHGTNGAGFDAFSLHESLAARGYVVAAPTHESGWFEAPTDNSDESLVRYMVERIGDLHFTLEAVGNAASPVQGHVDTTEVTAMGHSVGGTSVVQWATGLTPEDLAEQGLDPAPVLTELPRSPDPRVRAVVTLGGVIWVTSERQIATLEVPLLALHGDADLIVPQDPRLDALPSGEVVQISLRNAAHYAFTDVCRYVGLVRDAGGNVDDVFFGISQFEECLPSQLSPARTQAIAAAYTDAIAQYAADVGCLSDTSLESGTTRSTAEFTLEAR